MKILFVANYMWDIYIFRGGLLKALVADGHEVTAVAPDDGRIDMEKTIPGLKSISIALNKRGINPIEDMKLTYDLYKLYKRENPDIIFHYTIKPNIYGSIASKMAKKKSVAVLTGLGYSFVKGGLISKIAIALYRFSLKFSKEIWVLNSDDKETLIENKIGNRDKVFILPGEGTDCERFKPLPMERKDGRTIFLMVARAFFDKGFREYEEAARILREKYGDKVEFQFLGALGGEAVSGITEEYMNKLQEENIINYLGTVDYPENVIKEIDCLVLPSYREGISKVLMEGAAMEKPIIATNVTGCKEIVDDGENGYLVNVKDSFDLAQKMEKFILLPKEERKKMGKKGREKILKEFDEKIIIDIYRDKISKL
ncbi:MAG: glycosyltransferase family 4 protein [Fusobacterium varium]|nr:glycosyltransferase family 4 protein [Fusobacterium varium]